MGSTKVADEMLNRTLRRVAPCTLPVQAYGPNDIVWVGHGDRRMVWAWITWPDRAATRVKAVAFGWNDRVVAVRWDTDAGDVQCVVWRNAVTNRSV